MNPEKLTKRLERGAYVAIIVLTLVTTATLSPKLLGKFYRYSSNPTNRVTVKAGDSISVPGEDWAKNGKTLVLVLSTKCHFCSESAPLYRTILAKTRTEQKVHVASIFSQSVEEARKYLMSLEIDMADVQSVPNPSFEIHGTPTLLLVDHTGKVADLWVGKLSADQESDVLSKVTTNN
jgi:hypothetical protein